MTLEHHPRCPSILQARYTAKLEYLTAQVVDPRRKSGDIPAEFRPALEDDFHVWLPEFLPRDFRGQTSFASHHEEFLDWGWGVESGVKPSPSAAVLVINRRGNKSTTVAGLLTALAARGRRKYGLVITRTQDQADQHVFNVNRMILGSNITRAYPEMAPKVEKVVNRNITLAWNRQKLSCANGFTLQGFGILGSQRGIRIENYRPDFLWLTDIDDDNDSQGFVDTMLRHLSGAILAAQSDDSMIVFDQNLIHPDSVVSRILDGRTDILSDRTVIGPIPAVYSAKYERRHERWYITSGRAAWPQGFSIEQAERELNDVGKEVWEKEYQHNVTLPYKDAVYPQWDEARHVITEDEFMAFFGADAIGSDGEMKLPGYGQLMCAQDWGNRHNHPCATGWAWWPETGALADSVFFYREMVWPSFPRIEADPRDKPSAVKVGRAIYEAEKKWGENARMAFRLASHERPEIQVAYAQDLPLNKLPAMFFEPVNTSEAREGILRMQNLLTIIGDEEHPFRRYPAGHRQAGRKLVGRPRVYWIVARGQGELVHDETKPDELGVMPAVDERGQSRTRWEAPRYRKPDTSTGAEKKDPPKIGDDMMDIGRAIIGRIYMSLRSLSAEERVDLKMREVFKDEPSLVPRLDDAALRTYYMTRDIHRQKLLREELAEDQPVYGIGRKVDYKNDPYALLRRQLNNVEEELGLNPDDIIASGFLG